MILSEVDVNSFYSIPNILMYKSIDKFMSFTVIIT